MKQLNLNELVEAFCDQPKTIGERLAILGYSEQDLVGKIAPDALALSVYGSSFLKFLHDNAGKLEPAQTGAGHAENINPFDETALTIGSRLEALELDPKVISAMFSKDVLGLEMNGEQFQDFIMQNREKFLSYVDSLPAAQGGAQ